MKRDRVHKSQAAQTHRRMKTDRVHNSLQILYSLQDPKERFRTLPCDEECHKRARNARLALALQIENPDSKASLGTAQNQPIYSDQMKQRAKLDPNFANKIHKQLTELVIMARDSKQKSRSQYFNAMNHDKRKFVHDYAAVFGCETALYRLLCVSNFFFVNMFL